MSCGSGVPEKLGLQMGQRDLPPPGILAAWWGWRDSWVILERNKIYLVLANHPSYMPVVLRKERRV